MVQLRGDTATVSLRTTGLLNGSPHLMHIHAGGLGGCPPASAARIHNGHRAISTGDGIRFYGPAMTSLTEYGSTSGATPTNYDLDLYAASGNIRYSRTIVVKPLLASLIRRGNAVILVHGIDYDRNHKYDFAALGVSDLDEELPAEATAPALCGTLRASHQRIAGRESGRSSTTYVASVDQRTVPATAGRVSALSLLCHVGPSDGSYARGADALPGVTASSGTSPQPVSTASTLAVGSSRSANGGPRGWTS